MKTFAPLFTLVLLSSSLYCQAGFLDKFADEKLALSNSGFSIGYPEEKHGGGLTTIVVNAAHGKVAVDAHCSHKKMRTAQLAQSDYQSLIEMLRQLDEQAFTSKIPERCMEPIHLRVHAGGESKIFVGCRGDGLNATTLSKMVRKLEFLLAQNTGISE